MELLNDTRLIEIQGADLYYDFLSGKETIINNRSDEFDYRFKEIAPPNLDFLYLARRNKFKLHKLGDEYFSYDFINVSFKYPLYLNKKNKRVFPKNDQKWPKRIDVDTIREHLYLNGFTLNGKEYVRYKRSSGAAKSGSCLFIRKKLEPMMEKWSRTGLDIRKDNCYKDLTSYEAYKALSLSSIITTLNLEPRNILFVKDAKVILKNQKVIEVSCNKDKHLESKENICDIENNIFDGEGLLDSSVFESATVLVNGKEKSLAKKGMMLLRSRFFKCCAFNTNLKQWFEDNKITKINQLNGFTFADKVEDIVLVASESCLKYLKMCKIDSDKDFKNAIERWCNEINKDEDKFGVVKTDKPSRFFDGQMVETTYQLINTLELRTPEINKLTAPYFDYFAKVRDIKNTPEFIRFHLMGEDNVSYDYEDETEDANSEELAASVYKYSPYSFKNKVCLELINIDGNIKHTDLFKDRVFNSVTESLELKFYKGRVLVNGTYATLFGNPIEFLKYCIKDENGKPLFDKDNPVSIFKDGEISSLFFKNDEIIVGSRAPHTTMGNILVAKNKIFGEIKHYFNLTKEIVVVDAINNNIQHRLSGCDYDSDSMLITNDETLVKAAEKNYERFLVPYGNFKPSTKKLINYTDNKIIRNLYDIDNKIANNNVGIIVNLSQLLNSHLWNIFDRGKNPKINEIYDKIAILSVLSGAEIDSAKRTFDFDTVKELELLKQYADNNKYNDDDSQPLFFIIVKWNRNQRLKIGEIKTKIKTRAGRKLKTAMDYLWDKVHRFEHDPYIRTDTIPFIEFVSRGAKKDQTYDYEMVDKSIEVLGEIKKALNDIRDRLTNEEYELKKVEFNNQIRIAHEKLKNTISEPNRTRLLIKKLEEKDDGYTKLFILLYVLYKYSRKKFKLLFSNTQSKPLPTLKRTNEEHPDYILFKKHKYNIDENN